VHFSCVPIWVGRSWYLLVFIGRVWHLLDSKQLFVRTMILPCNTSIVSVKVKTIICTWIDFSPNPRIANRIWLPVIFLRAAVWLDISPVCPSTVLFENSWVLFQNTMHRFNLGFLRGSFVFLGYHVPQKEDRKSKRFLNTQNTPETRNISRSRFKNVNLEPPYTVRDEKKIINI